ncbi:HEAT repeat domain-containing protein [Micromonospora andamanensis]|uniref:HEAT repeat domain-containing protein n=1 Tax=Micromonospora andamanensis TaxID=1287068 RepID=UPI00194E31D5|nr:HEAT repeat domain-containing protein [Micromonospora andamanensis]
MARQETEGTEETDDIDDAEESLDPTDVLRQLAGLLGGGARIDVGDMQVHGQNATGHGALAIGTVNVTAAAAAAGGRVWSETLSEASVREVTTAYAPAVSDQQLDRQLKQRHLVCLSGSTGTGRFTSAIVTSARRHGLDRVGVLGIEQLADLLSSDSGPRRGCGYVLRVSDETVRSVDGYTLVALAARAEADEVTLLLVGDFSRRIRDLSGHVVEHRPAPAEEVFRMRLRRELAGRCVDFCAGGCDGACVERYVDEECGRHPMLAAYLSGEPRPREVVAVVEAIAQTAPRAGALTDRLAELLPRQLRERAARILDAEDGAGTSLGWSPTQVRAFRLCCAILAGLTTSEIRLAADRLVSAGEPVQSAAAPVRLRGTTLDELLGPTLRASVMVSGDEWTMGGVQLQFAPGSEELRSAVLDAAWTDWWPPRVLLGWLADLVRAEQPEVRQAAAGAVGWTAGRNVQAALDTVRELARERRAGVRQAAAIALVAMAMQPRLRQRVRSEMDSWSAGSAAHLRDTVARAHQLGLARLWPDAALVQLRLVASARMQRWNNSVVRGLVEVYQGGHAAALVSDLADWTRSPDREVRLHAARALRVLAERWARPPREQWPELLDHARTGVITPDDLATLWATSLSLPETAYRAWRTLGFWLNRADGQPEVAGYVLALLRLVVSGRPPLRRRLDHQLRHVWRSVMPRNALLDDVGRLICEDKT